jgi:hypothetical protein
MFVVEGDFDERPDAYTENVWLVERGSGLELEAGKFMVRFSGFFFLVRGVGYPLVEV